MQPIRSAEQFIDSVGVNVHLSYWGTPYGKRFPEVAIILERSGIRHLRDGMVLGQQRVCSEARELAEHGLHFTYITQPARSEQDLENWATCVGSAIEGYEAPNEYDISHPKSDLNWVSTIQMFQKRLFGYVKDSKTLRLIPVVGPSLTSQPAYQMVGDLSTYLDFGNTHDYFGGHEPETNGYGAGGYGSIGYNLRATRLVSVNKAIFATETGFGTADSSNNVPEDVQAVYVPRMFLDQFSGGIERTYEYEFVDEGGPPFSAMGLVDGNLRAKPAFTALTSMLALLNRKGSMINPVTTVPIDFNNSEGTKHLILQRRDGTCVVALWQEASSIEPRTRIRLPVPSLNVLVSVSQGWLIKSIDTYNSEFSLHARSINASSTHVTLGAAAQFLELEKR